MVIQPILVAIALAGCGSHPRAAQAPAAVVAVPEALPVVLFRLLVIRSWEDPWYVISSEDVDLTLPAALSLGIPAELWIRCALGAPGYRFEIYWVRPLHA
jgi:hypothetical protein